MQSFGPPNNMEPPLIGRLGLLLDRYPVRRLREVPPYCMTLAN
jgi:hypothetical protein